MKESKEKIEEQKELIRKITDINGLIKFLIEQLNDLLRVQQDLLNKILEEKINSGIKPHQDSQEETTEQSVTFTGSDVSLGSF